MTNQQKKKMSLKMRAKSNNILLRILLFRLSYFNVFPSDDDFLRIFLPMIDDEEQRRLEELEEEEEDWNFISDENQDDDTYDLEEDFL